jgi:hypothetical protein
VTQASLPSIVELAEDKGPIGQVLRTLPAWFLREADRCAEQDYKERHCDPNCLPAPDPWQFFLDAPAVSEQSRAVFRAAQSQLVAWRRLLHMAQGFATGKTDWHQEALEARKKGDKKQENHASRKLADAMAQFAPVQADVRKHAKDHPELLPQMEHWLKKRRAQLVHRGERTKAEHTREWPRWDEIHSQYPVESMLVKWWVRCGEGGVPGLMFFGNKALWQMLDELLSPPRKATVTYRNVKAMRQKLKLIPANDQNSWVWAVDLKRSPSGEWLITGKQRGDEPAFMFQGQIVFNNKAILPSSKVPKSCVESEH